MLSLWVSVKIAGMPKLPKISLHILQHLHKSMGDTVAFFPADKHKSFLQVDSITLGVRSQTGPKYQKQPVYNIFAISQGKHDVDFLPAD